jgi:4-hydroxy-tetrahydrodipicolinate synthase
LARVDGDIADPETGQCTIAPEGFSIGRSGDWTATETMIDGADTWYGVLGGLLPDICLKPPGRRNRAMPPRHVGLMPRSPVWDLCRLFSSLRVVYALVGLLDICRTESPRPLSSFSDSVKRQVTECLSQLEHAIRSAA